MMEYLERHFGNLISQQRERRIISMPVMLIMMKLMILWSSLKRFLSVGREIQHRMISVLHSCTCLQSKSKCIQVQATNSSNRKYLISLNKRYFLLLFILPRNLHSEYFQPKTRTKTIWNPISRISRRNTMAI